MRESASTAAIPVAKIPAGIRADHASPLRRARSSQVGLNAARRLGWAQWSPTPSPPG